MGVLDLRQMCRGIVCVNVDQLTCSKSFSPLLLKNQSTVAEPSTSLLRLQEMQPSLKPSPATASVSESTSAHAPRHITTGGERVGEREGGRELLGCADLSVELYCSFLPQDHHQSIIFVFLPSSAIQGTECKVRICRT